MNHREHTAFRMGADVVTSMAAQALHRIERDPTPADPEMAAGAAAALRNLIGDVSRLTPLKVRADEPEATTRARAVVEAEEGSAGTIPCPCCGRALDWIRTGERTIAFCETEGCVAWAT